MKPNLVPLSANRICIVCARLQDLGAPVPGGWEEAQKAAKKDKS